MFSERFSLSAIAKKFSVSLLLLVLVFMGCLATLFAVADMIFEDKNLLFDEHVFAFIRPYINNTNTAIFSVITFFGSTGFLLPANTLLVLYVLLVKKERRNAWKVAAVSITSTLELVLLKNGLQRQRPPSPIIAKLHNYSFPSGHTFSSVVFFGMLAYLMHLHIKQPLLKWSLILLLTLLVLAIGISRVYLRYHYASDVIAGFCLGILWLLLAKWILFKTKNLQT